MTRIIAGAAKGRRLSVPPGIRTRPTSDRAREGLFATVTALRGSLQGARVLDLYAGSGAIGLEALSRGAEAAVFVESDARAARLIRSNLAAVRLPGGQVINDRVARFLARAPSAGPGRGTRHGPDADPRWDAKPSHGTDTGPYTQPGGGAQPGPYTQPGGGAQPGPGTQHPFDLVVADPPYAVEDEEIAAMLMALARGWLAPGAIVAVERASRSAPLTWPPGCSADRSHRYGEATFWYGLAAGV